MALQPVVEGEEREKSLPLGGKNKAWSQHTGKDLPCSQPVKSALSFQLSTQSDWSRIYNSTIEWIRGNTKILSVDFLALHHLQKEQYMTS